MLRTGCNYPALQLFNNRAAAKVFFFKYFSYPQSETSNQTEISSSSFSPPKKVFFSFLSEELKGILQHIYKKRNFFFFFFRGADYCFQYFSFLPSSFFSESLKVIFLVFIPPLHSEEEEKNAERIQRPAKNRPHSNLKNFFLFFLPSRLIVCVVGGKKK